MVSFADRDEVRRTGKFLRRERRNDFADGITNFFLSEDAFAIRVLKRDGSTEVESIDFDFTEPKLITLTGGGAVIAPEQFIIEYDTQISDEDIDLAIRHAKEDIRDQVSHIVDSSTLADWEAGNTPPQIVEKALRGAVLYVEQMILKANKVYGDERDMNHKLIMQWKTEVKKYRTGESQLVDVETDMTSRISIGHGGDLIFTDQPTIDEKLDLSRKQDRKEAPAF